MKTFNPSLYIVIFGCLALFLSNGCTKENMEDDRPDFIFQGTLTDITDGTPKEGWTVSLQEHIPLFNRPPIFVATTFGYDSISSEGGFSMDVSAFSDLIREGNSPYENTPDEKQAFYLRHNLSFRAPGPYNDLAPNDIYHMFLDPDDKDLKLGEFDFSKKGEVITRNVEIFTGDRGRVNYRYLVERSFGQEEFFTLSTSFRDLAYNRAFFAINPSIFGLIRRGEWYERTVILPVGRPVEAVTSFKTFFRLDNNLRELVDSLIIRDTFLLQTAADTLQQRDYTY